MSPHQSNQLIRNALDQWLRSGQMDTATHNRISELYPLTRWDWRSLGRWFLTFGAISLVAGLVLFLREHLTPGLSVAALGLAAGLSVVLLGLFIAGRQLPLKGYKMLGSIAELLGGFALIGLSLVLSMICSDSSDNWPALLLVDLILMLLLSYALGNVLLLTMCSVLFFVWFGGRTGYDSDWSAYWISMNYPLRFLAASVVLVAAGVLHLRCEWGVPVRYRGFAKVWIAFGMFVGEMSLWVLSIFGNFDNDDTWSPAKFFELFVFNLLWGAVNLCVIGVGLGLRFRMLVGHGVTFLLIQFYTLLFTFIAATMSWLFGMFVAGTSLLLLIIVLQSQRQKRDRPKVDTW